MGIPNPAKMAEKAAKSAVDHVIKPAANTVVDTVIKPAGKAAEAALWKLRKASYAAIKKLAEESHDAIWKLRHETWDTIKRLESKSEATIENAGKTAIVDLKHIGSEIKSDVELARRTLDKYAVKPLVRELSDDARYAYHKLEDVAHEVEELPGELVGKVLNEMAKISVQQWIDCVKMVTPSEIFLQIGPVMIYFADIEGRIQQVTDWAESNPDFTKRSEILRMIKTLAPHSVGLDFQAEAAFLLVASKSVSIDFQVKYDINTFCDNLDDLLKRW